MVYQGKGNVMVLGLGFWRMVDDYIKVAHRIPVTFCDVDNRVEFVTGFVAYTTDEAYGHMYDIVSRRIDVAVN